MVSNIMPTARNAYWEKGAILLNSNIKNFRILKFRVHNRIHHEKLCKMNTNKPMFGQVILYINGGPATGKWTLAFMKCTLRNVLSPVESNKSELKFEHNNLCILLKGLSDGLQN